jgi:hypothetical protein
VKRYALVSGLAAQQNDETLGRIVNCRGESEMKLEPRRAVGELAIIILGVLIALWVDELRQMKTDRATEAAYVQGLATDLRNDIAELDSATVWSSRFEAAAGTVLSFLDGEPKDLDSLVSAVVIAGWQYPPEFSTHTIDDLRSTGNLRLINDPDLKRAVSSYYQAIERYERLRQPLIERVWDGYDSYVGEVLSPSQRLEALRRMYPGEGDLPDTPWPDASLDDVRRAFVQNPEIRLSLNDVIYGAAEQRNYLVVIRSVALRTLQVVEAAVD